MIKGWKKLTKKERKHLAYAGILRSTLRAQKTFDVQQRQRDDGDPEPCFECKLIAEKLGMIR